MGSFVSSPWKRKLRSNWKLRIAVEKGKYGQWGAVDSRWKRKPRSMGSCLGPSRKQDTVKGELLIAFEKERHRSLRKENTINGKMSVAVEK